jgi:hypothetical protein
MTTKSTADRTVQLSDIIKCGSAVTPSQASWRAYKTFGADDIVPNYWTIESNDYTTNGFSISGYIHDDDVAHLVLAANSHHAMKEALEEIALGRGPYKMDPHEHAVSVIEAMKEVAIEALSRLTKEI